MDEPGSTSKPSLPGEWLAFAFFRFQSNNSLRGESRDCGQGTNPGMALTVGGGGGAFIGLIGG